MYGSIRPKKSTANHAKSDTPPTILNEGGVSSFGPSSMTRVPSVVSKNIALSPATMMKNTFAHHAALGTYMCGAMMKNKVPVAKFIAKPVIAQGMNAFAAETG